LLAPLPLPRPHSPVCPCIHIHTVPTVHFILLIVFPCTSFVSMFYFANQVSLLSCKYLLSSKLIFYRFLLSCYFNYRAIEVRSPTGADFSSSPCVQTGSGAHPASYSMGIGGSFPGGKARPGRNADHSPPSSAEVKYE
jgi:hypothetical protein